MALVPYRVSGAAADQHSDERLLQLPGGLQLRLRQQQAPPPPPSHPPVPYSAGAAAASVSAAIGAPAGSAVPVLDRAAATGPPLERLAGVGFVVWQAGWVLAEYLLRVAPFGRGGTSGWRSVTAVDLGTGTGLVGIALAAAGARVVLTDLPHVLPLAAANLAANCGGRCRWGDDPAADCDPRVTRAAVCAYRWGDDPAAADPSCTAAGTAQQPSPLAGLEPDLLTAGDVLYHPELAAPLMAAVQALSAPHTVTYVSYRVRQGGEAAAFVRLAEAAGFAVQAVPAAELHEEYRSVVGGGGEGEEEEEEAQAEAMEVGVEEEGEDAGRRRRQRHGAYGILRLCRRDCSAAAAAPLAAVRL